MNLPTNGRFRVLIDGALTVSILSMTFALGQLWERVHNLEMAVTTPGRVQISIEARTRLEVLEEQIRQKTERDRQQDERMTWMQGRIERLEHR
jgi:hypothetical protein